MNVIIDTEMKKNKNLKFLTKSIIKKAFFKSKRGNLKLAVQRLKNLKMSKFN